jgi:polysaccharide biosynthesis/export protein
MRRVVRNGLALVAAFAVFTGAAAQPLPATPQPATSSELGGGGLGGQAKIPVTSGGTEVLGAEGAGTSSIAAAISLEHPVDPDSYVCGPGDVFELVFWGQQNFRIRIAIDLEGRTFISKVGYVVANGKSLTTVRNEIKNKVRKNYPGLMFDLMLVSPRTFVVHVVDNVKSPGGYVSNPLERVSSVISKAGGASGSRRRIQIKRDGKTLAADLVKYELSGDISQNPFVLDGDIISIPHADTVVTIDGAVRRPGTYELVGSKDVNELLELAGGLATSVAASLPARLIRRNAEQHLKFDNLSIFEKKLQNVQLIDGDKILVSSDDELQRSVFLLGAVVGADPLDAATTTKRLPYIDGDTVRSLIERAGGIKAPGDLKRSYISRPRANQRPELIAVDLDALLIRRDFKADQSIAIGDTIVVPQMRHSVLVEGAVARPGFYGFNPSFGLSEYVAQAGGRTRTAKDLDDAKLVEPDGKIRDAEGAHISPGDSILVPERNWTRSELVQLFFAGAGLLISTVALVYSVNR